MKQNLTCTFLYIFYLGIEVFTLTTKSETSFNWNTSNKNRFSPEVAIALERNDLLHGDLLFRF